MSNDELQKLKALALCATAGPWGCFANEEDSGEVSHDVIAINSGVHIFSEDHLPSEETAQYIAAASPDVILALIAKVEATPSSANGAEGLPELPEPSQAFYRQPEYFTADQMQAYALLAISQAKLKW